MPDYRAPNGWTEGDEKSGLFLSLMDRLRNASHLSPQEKEDTFRDAAMIGNNPDALDTSMYNSFMHPLQALGLAKSPLPALPDKPATFRREPLVVGQPDKARAVSALLSSVPDLKGSGNEKIVFGPTIGSDIMLDEKGLNPIAYDLFGLLGVHDSSNGHISINPGFQREGDFYGRVYGPKQPVRDLPGTLAHELMHGRGFGDREAYKLEEMIPAKTEQLMQQILMEPRRLR